MFGCKADATSEQLKNCKDMLLSLPAKIKTIFSHSLGEDLKLPSGQLHPGGKNRSIVWQCDFASVEDFEAYQTHVAHVACINDGIKPVMEPGSRAAIHYDIGKSRL